MSVAGLTTVEANNFLRPEDDLVQLLRAAVAGLSPAVHVLTSADLAGVQEAKQHTPALHLIYGGFRVAERSGTAWRLDHTWWAVAAVKTAATVRSGKQAREDAGALIELAMNALAGASVAGYTKPLDLINPPAAYYSAGHQYIPAAFRAESIFKRRSVTP